MQDGIRRSSRTRGRPFNDPSLILSWLCISRQGQGKSEGWREHQKRLGEMPSVAMRSMLNPNFKGILLNIRA